MNRTTAVLCTVWLLHVAPLTAQYSISGFDLEGGLDNWYDTVFVGKNPELFEGSFYEIPGRTLSDHPFLGDGQWRKGTITFRGQQYEEVGMIYDLMNNALVIRNMTLFMDSREFLRINPRQVSTFTLFDDHFVRYDGARNPPPGSGFYKLLYDEKEVLLIARITKTSRVSHQGIEFDQRVQYFIDDKNGFSPMRGKRDFLLRYYPHKKVIKRFIRTRRLKIQRGNDAHYVRLLSFCEQLDQG